MSPHDASVCAVDPQSRQLRIRTSALGPSCACFSVTRTPGHILIVDPGYVEPACNQYWLTELTPLAPLKGEQKTRRL
jgi:hypothetical protein